jgi:hypothetical protein
MDMRRWGLAAAALLCALYLFFPDKVYVFDGVMFSFVIERDVPDLAGVLYNRRHLLFTPLMLGLRDLLLARGVIIGGYELMQRVNAVAGALGALLFFRLLLRLTRDQALSAVTTLLLAFSYSWWSRATEGQVYMLMSLGSLATVWAACALLAEPRPLWAATLAAAWAAATLVHGANAVLLPVAAAALWLAAPPEKKSRFAPALLAMLASVAACYAWAFSLRTPSSVLPFLLEAAEFPPGETGRRILELPANLGQAPSQLLRSLAAAAGAGWLKTVLGLALGAALFRLGLSAWPALEQTRRRSAVILFSAGLLFVLLDAFWRGGLFFWAIPAAVYLALAALFLSAFPEWRVRTLRAGAILVFVLAVWNFRAGILPQSLVENNDGVRRALFVQEHTVPTSWVIMSGMGFPNSKIYLTKFARRNTRVLEYHLREAPKDQAMAKFGAFIRDLSWRGLPIYVLSDLLSDAHVSAQLHKQWGVTPKELRESFGPGTFRRMADYDEALGVYLFIPAAGAETLFVGLAFNVLDMPPGPAFFEAGAVLKELGLAMTPPQRRRTAQLLRDTRYGALTTFAAIKPYLLPAAQPGAESYARNFLVSPMPAQKARLAELDAFLSPR